MNETLKAEAKKLSDHFINHEQEYRMGFLEAEQSNPKTKTLGETFVQNSEQGIKMLLSVDEDLIHLFQTAVLSQTFHKLYEDVFLTLKNGGRIILSGCGSSGRLGMRIEASWRKALHQYPELSQYLDKVLALMTGGDYAIIRAVESFEDYIQLGVMQALELKLSERDMLIGVTATGETTSIIGTAKQALADGAKVCMVVCTDPKTVIGKLKRVDDVYQHKNCYSLYMPCGGMGVTGSTRMQSSSIEQAIITAVFELVLNALKQEIGFEGKKSYKQMLIDGFQDMIYGLYLPTVLKVIEEQIEEEQKLYEKHGYVTYFSDEYQLDILTDTTERGPTFNTPPFRPQNKPQLPLSWAFVKNPLVPCKEAWRRCFGRIPRCVDKTEEEYLAIGIMPEDIKRIPQINLEALYEYKIGNEPDPERYTGESLASWIGLTAEIPEEFYLQAKEYKYTSSVVLPELCEHLMPTELMLFEHIAMKMILNIISTGTMAKMGRIYGNYMICLDMSNKKLVDRGSRIIADLCNISYEQANYELYYSKVFLDSQGKTGSATQLAIERLKNAQKD